MERCNRLVDIGRRQFLRGSAFAAAGLATAGKPADTGKGGSGLALVEYPSNRLANVADLKPNEPLDVAYPDERRSGRASETWHRRLKAAPDLTAISSAFRRFARIRAFR